MFGKRKQEQQFFESLCEIYYEKILRYLYAVLEDEAAARDCTQDVFLTACQKAALLLQHPNPGGFLFQTAKNLAKKIRRESFRRMVTDVALEDMDTEPQDSDADIERMIDGEIDEQEYIEAVLAQLSPEKRTLYTLYYVNRNSMGQIANMLHLEEPALRMRYVRLRREIRAIAAQVAEQYFIS